MMARPRRPRRLLRRRGLIVTEGTVTEPLYFDRLKQLLPRDVGTIDVVGVGQDPLSVVRTALKRRRAARGDEKYDWCCAVVDVDQHQSLSEATALAASESSPLVITQPCFELWLLWHVSDKAPTTSSGLQREIAGANVLSGKALANSYSLTLDLDAVDRAIAMALRKDPELRFGRKGPMPSTAMPELIRLIRTGK
ncbi:RloB family protein [Aestuariimicrobium sp. Y1814]|uniref:RloB family protein n=1 Tax=Aestuariimicrobium sp. Y1814 TaxID=3418742 RepID=UPI003DA6D367